MANRKISALAQLAGTAIASGDKIPIVDASDTTDDPSTGTTKYVDGSELFYKAVGGTVTANSVFSGTVTLSKIVPPSNAAALITVANPSTTVPTLDIVSGTAAGVTIRLADLTANGTVKQARMTTRHYDSGQVDVMFYFASNNATQNIVYYGGASGVLNCVTEHSFYCGTANTQKTGAEIVKITNALVNVNGTVQTDAFRLDQTPTSGAVVLSHYITISANGITYRIPCGTA